MENDRRFSLLSGLQHDPPFWFHHALAFCRFERSQFEHLIASSINRPDDELYEQSSLSKTYASSNIQYAIECGLIEPIFHSIVEYDGDLEELMNILLSTSHNMGSKFPWMFLAYLGACNQNLELVKRCINIIIEEKKADILDILIEEFEVGISYMVWRFLVAAGSTASNCTVDELGSIRASMLQLPLAKHDWTFVHLASAYGDIECLRILLDQPDNQKNHEVLSAATEVEGFTPLHLAAYYGHAHVVRLLLEHADKLHLAHNIPRDRIFKRSPLHFAALMPYPEVVSILIEKWGSEGVDLRDRFGMTSLHCAIHDNPRKPTGLRIRVLIELLAVSKYPNQKVSRDFALQKSALLGVFLARRRYVDSATSTLFIPSPDICSHFLWCNLGSTFLHCIAIYGWDSQFAAVLQYSLGTEASLWAAQDCHGLNALDYADANLTRFAGFFHIAVETVVAIADAHQEQKIHVNRPKAMSQLLKGDQIQKEVIFKLMSVYELGNLLLSGDYATAVLKSSVEMYQTYHPIAGSSMVPEPWKWKVDDEVWDHLEWALNKAVQQDSAGVAISKPRLHPAEAEQIVLQLAVQRKILQGKSPKQRCLQWAIGKRMAKLAEELVKDPECELVSVVPGGKHEESPLARASKSNVAKDMPGLLAAMELREDVKRRWFEDRQVYVDYANTLLVGAVLIAGLAFAGWLQPPRGYIDNTGAIDMNRQSMRAFVWSSSLAFFLGMGTMVAGATGAMPFAMGAGKLVSARDKVNRSVVVASMLLIASIGCLAIAFSAALLAILPSDELAISSFLAVNGLFLCWMLFSFARRLQGLGRSWILSRIHVPYWARKLLPKFRD